MPDDPAAGGARPGGCLVRFMLFAAVLLLAFFGTLFMSSGTLFQILRLFF